MTMKKSTKKTRRERISPEKAARELEDSPKWIVEHHRIYRDFRFADFSQALRFVNRVATVAEKVGHHPNITMHEYAFVRIETYDHMLSGLSNFDLKLVRAIDQISGQ